jgi:2-keto-myo-inositol isomerase
MAPRFALNHIVAPRLELPAFFALAASLGIGEVEIRNDLPAAAALDRTSPAAVREAARRAGVTILTINALQRFDDWGPTRADEAAALADYAAGAGARGLVLVPANDGSRGGSPDQLPRTLEALGPILEDRGIAGLIEPLGFATCSLRSKRIAAAAIAAVGRPGHLRLVHDTFHHALAGEPALYPELTGLVHLSGVTERSLPVEALRDHHRGLVSDGDRLGTVDQARSLLAQGYAGPLSLEPFAPELHALADPARAIGESLDFVRRRLLEEAA